ncbi:MAG: outer membrane protein assembly factor BamB family protein, partial [Planctomycetota bacterium]
WVFDMKAELGVNLHDETHASILIDGRFLYAPTSNGVDAKHKIVLAPQAPSLVVLDKNTGKLLATDDENIGPQIVHCTWSSPAIGEVNGRKLIFFAGGNGVIFAFEALNEPHRTPRVSKLKRIWRFDTDPDAPKDNPGHFQGNREEGPVNVTGMPVFDKGRIYVTPGGDLWHGKHEAWLKCIDTGGAGDITRTGEVWSQPLNRHCMSTPSVHDGLVYVADTGRTVHCFEADTGKPVWKADVQGDVWGSTLVADGKVFVGTRRGVFWILKAGREKEVLATVKLDSPVSASPAAANGVLYVCSMQKLYAIEVE